MCYNEACLRLGCVHKKGENAAAAAWSLALPSSPRSAPDASFGGAFLCQPPGFRPSPAHKALLALLALPDLQALRQVCSAARSLVTAGAAPLLPAFRQRGPDSPPMAECLARALTLYPLTQCLCLVGWEGVCLGAALRAVQERVGAVDAPLSLTLRFDAGLPFPLQDLLPLAPRLVALDLSGSTGRPYASSLCDADVVAIVAAQRAHRQLRVLRVSYNGGLTGAGWVEGMAGCLGRLVEFRCAGCRALQPGCLAAVLAAPSLQVLDVSECRGALTREDFARGAAGRRLRHLVARGMCDMANAWNLFGAFGGVEAQWPPAAQALLPRGVAAPPLLLREVEVLALQGNYALQEEVLTAAPLPRLRELSLVGCGVVCAEAGERGPLAPALRQLCSSSPALQHVDGCFAFGREAAEATGGRAVLVTSLHGYGGDLRGGEGGSFAGQWWASQRSVAAGLEGAAALGRRQWEVGQLRSARGSGCGFHPGGHRGQWIKSFPHCTATVLFLQPGSDGYGTRCEHGVSHCQWHFTCCGSTVWHSACDHSARAAMI